MIDKDIILDSSVMTKLIDGKEPDILKKLSDLKVKSPVTILVNATSFMNAIWNADANSPIKNIKKIMGIAEIFPDANIFKYKDDEKVKDAIIEFAKEMSKLREKITLERENKKEKKK